MQSKENKEIVRFLKGYKHIAERADEAMFVHDTSGTIFDVNKTAEKLTGYTKKELLKMNVKEIHTKTERRVSEKALKLISESKVEVNFESQFVKKDGKIVDVRIIGDKFKFRRHSFVIDLVKDVTAYRKFSKKKIKMDITRGRKFFKFLIPHSRVYTEPAQVLIEVAESRDPYTMEHAAKVTDYATQLAGAIGLPKKEIEILKLACMFHDIGKIGIKSHVLMKTTCLSNKEYEEVKEHPLLSVEIIKSIKPVEGLIPIIRHHHENYDGTGYPDRLRGERIPLGARILAIADVYDALMSERAYRKSYSYRGALKIMKGASGKKFDPKLLDRFLECLFQEKQKKDPR